MKLVLYSGGNAEANFELNDIAVKLTGKLSPKLGFIPSASYDAEVDFKYFVEEFSPFGVAKFQYLCADTPFSKTALNEFFKSDLIFLGGGNTFYFLKHLKSSGLFDELKLFAKNGGVLCGLSAGAIIMTPHVHTATFPHFDRDENPFDMKNLTAMRLVEFEFFPHYKNSKRYEEELNFHSKKIKHPLFASSDGGGIVIENHSVRFVGKTYQFFQGKKMAYNKL